MHNETRRPSSPSRWLLAVAGSVLAVSVAMAAQTRTAKPAPSPATPQGASAVSLGSAEFATVGEELTGKVCATECHGLEMIDDVRKTGREWTDVIRNMLEGGAVGTDKEFGIVQQYLQRYHGLVFVNIAPAEELAAVLGLSIKDAQAIVEYRKTHGKFADAAALAKVPGIDRTAIEKQPDAVRFN